MTVDGERLGDGFAAGVFELDALEPRAALNRRSVDAVEFLVP